MHINYFSKNTVSGSRTGRLASEMCLFKCKFSFLYCFNFYYVHKSIFKLKHSKKSSDVGFVLWLPAPGVHHSLHLVKIMMI